MLSAVPGIPVCDEKVIRHGNCNQKAGQCISLQRAQPADAGRFLAAVVPRPSITRVCVAHRRRHPRSSDRALDARDRQTTSHFLASLAKTNNAKRLCTFVPMLPGGIHAASMKTWEQFRCCRVHGGSGREWPWKGEDHGAERRLYLLPVFHTIAIAARKVTALSLRSVLVLQSWRVLT